MRVLVTGGTGLLGWWVVDTLVNGGYRVYATYHGRKPSEHSDIAWLYLDLEDPRTISEAIRESRPDIIVHTAAYTDVDGCEVYRDKAYRVNYVATASLVKVSEEFKPYFIYISTDYVFSGEKGMYRENDIPSPVNFYGLTKLLGEIPVEIYENSAVVRVSGLYGYSPYGKKNFGLIALEKLLNRETVNAFHDQYLSPTYVVSLAKSIAKLIEIRATGIIHIAGERMSRYEFAKMLARKLGVNEDLVKPVSIRDADLRARRPRDSSLDTGKAQSLGISIPSVDKCLEDFIERYIQKR